MRLISLKIIFKYSSRWITILSYYAVSLLTSSYCFAQVYTGPVSSATGGAGRAATEVGETILLNPATVVHSPDFSASIHYQDGYWAQNFHERTYVVSLVDNHKETIIPGGLTYINKRRHFSSLGSFDEMFIQATVGQFVLKHLSVGLALTYLKQDYRSGFTQWNGQVGVMYNPNSKIGLGLVVQNFIPQADKIPLLLREHMSVGGGLIYLFEDFVKFKADVVAFDIDKRGFRGKYMFGMESDLGDFISVRLGWNKSDVNSYKYYTLGLAFNGPQFRVDYSYQQKDTERRGAMHSVDIRVPL